MLTKQTEDSNSLVVHDLVGSHLDRPVNKIFRSSIDASKVSFKQPNYAIINNTTMAVPAVEKEFDVEEVKSEESLAKQIAYFTNYRDQKSTN